MIMANWARYGPQLQAGCGGSGPGMCWSQESGIGGMPELASWPPGQTALDPARDGSLGMSSTAGGCPAVDLFSLWLHLAESWLLALTHCC